MNKKKHLNKGGFTMIELIVVIAIIAILIAIFSGGLINFIATAQKTACDAQIKSLKEAYIMEVAHSGKIAGDVNSAKQTLLDTLENRYNITLTDTYTMKGLCPTDGDYCAKFNNRTSFTIGCRKHNKPGALLITDEYIGKVDSTLEELIKKNPNRVEGTYWIKELYEAAGNSLEKVDADLINKLYPDSVKMDTRDLYWRPSVVLTGSKDKRDYIMFAGAKNDDTQSQWKGYVAIYQDKVYVIDHKNKNKYDIHGNLAGGNLAIGANLDPLQWLKGEGFVEATNW